MIERNIFTTIEKYLLHDDLLLIIGVCRQVKKTTILKELENQSNF